MLDNIFGTYKPALHAPVSRIYYHFMKGIDETVREQLEVLREQSAGVHFFEDDVDAIAKFVSDKFEAVTNSEADFLDYCCLTHFDIYKDELREFTLEELLSLNKLIDEFYYRIHCGHS